MSSDVDSNSVHSAKKNKRVLVRRFLIAALIVVFAAIAYSFFLVYRFHMAIDAFQKQKANLLVSYESDQGEMVLRSYGAIPGPSFIPAPIFRYYRSLYYIGLRNQPQSTSNEIDQLFRLFRQFPKLKQLNLEGFSINQERAAAISHISNLQAVFLKRCQIQKSCLESILNLEGLTLIYLSDSDFEEDELKTLSQSSAKKTLISLIVSNCKVTDESASLISQCQNLEVLALDGTQITDQGLKQLARLPKLRYLSLDHTSVTNSGVAHLSSASQLEELSLSNTSVSDDILESLKQEIPALRISDD